MPAQSQPNKNNITLDNLKSDAARSIALDTRLEDSYKLVHKYRSLFCSYYADINDIDNKIHPPKIDCYFVISKRFQVFMVVDGVFKKRYDVQELISQICAEWPNISAWYKQYNEQTLNQTVYDE